MTYYLPGYTYLFASTCSLQEAPCFVRLRKEYIKAVLQDLHDTFHHVYVLLENLPENRFALVRYHDHIRNKLRPDSLLETDTFSLRQFCGYYDLFHEQDRFRVLFFTEVFYYEQSLTPHVLEIVYSHYLKYVCEQSLRENKPLRLTRRLIRKHGLKKSDAKIVRRQIEEHNANITADIQMEYSAIVKLDCIKK